jgi:hypothetical protein
MGSDKGTKTGRLAKLTQMENEVAKLSEQLKEDKKTILLLKKSLTERDLKIHELESKLVYAQQSLLKKTVFTIHQCRNQIINGIDEKIVNPALTQIQQQIEVIQGIVFEAKDFISKKKILVHENIHATSNIVHQCPDQAIIYFEKWAVEPARSLINEAAGLIDGNIKNSRELVEQKIISPGKEWYDRIVEVALALPTQTQVIFQVWLADPAMQKIEALPVIGKELVANADVLRKSLISQLKSGAEQGLANIVDAIKKSQFWDGKGKMGVAQ